jgi:hypothetical protein
MRRLYFEANQQVPKAKKALIPYKDQIPCVHEDIGYMGEKEGCEIECEWEVEHDCGPGCLEYKARQIEVCKKHQREFVGLCPDCEADFWGGLGRKLDKQRARELWAKEHLRLTLTYSCFTYLDAWVLNISPKCQSIYQFTLEGKRLWRGFQVTGFHRSIILKIWPNFDALKERRR